MRAAWRTMEEEEIDPYANASWPSVPAGLAALVARF
jgi:hypothetical protein